MKLRKNNRWTFFRRTAIAAALLVCACLIVACAQEPEILPGVAIPEDASAVDFTQKELTPEEYETIAAARPEVDILWNVPLSTGRYPSDSASLILPGFTESDAAMLSYFPALSRLDVTGEADYTALMRAQTAYPACWIRWQVSIGAQTLDNDAVELDVSGQAIDLDTLTNAVAALPALRRLYVRSTGLDARELTALMSSYPQLALRADVALMGKSFASTDTELDFSGRTDLDFAALLDALPYFSQLAEVNLTGCEVPEDMKDKLAAAAPDTLFVWEVALADTAVASSRDERFDLSGHAVADFDEFRRQFAFCKRAAYADMSHCGLSDAQMEQLMTDFPNVRFVWVVSVGAWELRTDITGFSTGISKSRNGIRLTGKAKGRSASITNESAAPLKYCTDLIALDLGEAGNLTDVSFIKDLKKLQYLVLSNTSLTDLSPVSGLSELVFLEVYRTTDELDIRPIANLKKLQYFNCSGVQRPDMETLSAMPSLVRLWVIKCGLTDEEVAALNASLPTCTVRAAGPHVSASWYYHNATYAAMQNIFSLPLEGQRKE